MEKKFDFTNIENHHFIIEENDFFTIYENSELIQYNVANYLQLKYSPTIEEFLIIEQIYMEYLDTIELRHIHIKWPEDIGIHLDVFNYLGQKEYKIGKKELMHLEPDHLTIPLASPLWTFSFVDETTIKTFLAINYKEDVLHGEDFAELKQKVYRYLYKQPHIQFLLVSLDGRALGSTIVIHKNSYLEIDHVLTTADSRNMGVASSIVRYLANYAKKSDIILVVDAEDTPKNMYEKFGFRNISSQISIEIDL